MKTLVKILMIVMALGIVGYAMDANATSTGSSYGLDGCMGDVAGECVTEDKYGNPHEGVCQIDPALCNLHSVDMLIYADGAASTCDHPQISNACNQVFPDPNGDPVKTICTREEIDVNGDGVITSPILILQQIEQVKANIKDVEKWILYLEDRLAQATDPEEIAKLEADIAYSQNKLNNYLAQLADLELLLDSADQVFLHLTCVAPSVNELACLAVVSNPAIDTTEFFPGTCMYPSICGDGRWSLKEACDPTAEVTGCKEGYICNQCKECLSDCVDGDPCFSVDSCGYGICDDLQISRQCDYIAPADLNGMPTNCSMLDWYSEQYLGGNGVCETLYDSVGSSSEMVQQCNKDPATGELLVSCAHENVDKVFCENLFKEGTIIEGAYMEGGIDWPSKCTWWLDPSEAGLSCSDPLWMGSVCDRVFGPGQALTYCSEVDTAVCASIADFATCKETSGCLWMEAPIPGNYGCEDFDESQCDTWGSVYCAWDSKSQLCKVKVVGQCLGGMQIDCIGRDPNESLPIYLCAMPEQLLPKATFADESIEGSCNCGLFDQDGDGVPDAVDNCLLVPNDDQADYDGDGEGNACDCSADGLCWNGFYCENIMWPDPDCVGCIGDKDHDGICDQIDNCRKVPNTDQLNTDGDITGDACDCDSDDALCTAEMYCVKADTLDENCCNDIDYNDQGEMVGDGVCKAEEDAACVGDPKAYLNPNIYPGADDSKCDGIDNNCDGNVDEMYKPFQCGACEEPADPVEYLESAAGSSSQCGPLCINDSVCVAGDESCTPLPPTKFYLDGDKDLFGVDFDSVQSCDAVPGYVMGQFDPNGNLLPDCVDDDNRIYPGAPDTCGFKDGETVVVDRGCGDGFDDINCDEICVDKDDDLFAGEKPADWIDGCGIVYTMKKEACSWMCPWLRGIDDCDDNNPRVYPGASGEVWGEGIDTDCDGIYCGAKTDYEHGLDCVGTPVVVNNMEEIKAYMVDYGWTGNKYSALRIAGDIAGEHVDIHSPCTIDILKGVKFAAVESESPTLCIDSMRGIQNDNGYVIDKFDRAGVLSSMGRAYVGAGSKVNVGSEFIIASGDRAYIGKNSDVSVKGLARVISIGDGPTADASLQEGVNFRANALLVRANRNASIGHNAVVEAPSIKVYSEGKDNDSKAQVEQKAFLTGDMMSIAANGGVGVRIDQFARFASASSSPDGTPLGEIFVNCEDNVDGCKIHKKAIFEVGKMSGNCMEDTFCGDGLGFCSDECKNDALDADRKGKCTSTKDAAMLALWLERYAAEMDCWDSYTGDLKAADACAGEVQNAFVDARKVIQAEYQACAMPFINEAMLCFDTCEIGCGESACQEGIDSCLAVCKAEYKPCGNACDNWAQCGEPCYNAYRARNDICDSSFPNGGEEWTQCIWDSIIEYRQCDTPCQRERTTCDLPCESANTVCQVMCQVRCDAFGK